jgi:D-arabinose 5-phosphate isomerase GutQ
MRTHQAGDSVSGGEPILDRATLAVGDALAVALMVAGDFGPEQFGQHHPGGALGRRLLGET